MPHSIAVDRCGPIAQSVEQLAFNQWVAGSSPARLTTNKETAGAEASRFLFSRQVNLFVLRIRVIM